VVPPVVRVTPVERSVGATGRSHTARMFSVLTVGVKSACANMGPMGTRITLTLDCTDPERLARFWAAALDYEDAGRHDEFCVVKRPDA
jgi:Glyoxalase-like domain